MSQLKQNRRQFIRNSSTSLLGAGIASSGIISHGAGNGEEYTPRILKYNILGRTGFRVSDIGFGSPADPAIIKAALNAGVNYLDTARIYGNSEANIGSILGEYNRRDIFITTKIMSDSIMSKETVLNSTRKSLEMLKVEYIDCFVLQSCQSREMVKNEAFHEAYEQLKQEGRVRFRGISCHGTYLPDNPEDSMENILLYAIEDGRFDLLLVVYNFLHSDPGARVLKAAKEKNMATTIMKSNPVKKYYFFKEMVDKAAEQNVVLPEKRMGSYTNFKNYMEEVESRIAELGFISNDEQLRDLATKFTLSNPNADCTLIPFKSFSDLEVHLKCSGTYLNTVDKEKLDAYRQVYNSYYCRHGCGICETSCPHGVPVNTILRYNYYFMIKGEEKYAMNLYHDLAERKADACLNCPGYCEQACPYGVVTKPLLTIAHQNLQFKST